MSSTTSTVATSNRDDPAADQLQDQQRQQQQQQQLMAPNCSNHHRTTTTTTAEKKKKVLVASHGAPAESLTASLTAGPAGPVLLQDFALLDHLSHFDRERIPERVVHAKGAGARGYFQVSDSGSNNNNNLIRSICKASVFAFPGKKTPVAVRFSTVGGEAGSADTARDPRGFAVKFFTDDGNWDLVGNNTPIFFLRDPILFPSFIHTQKRNPATHLKDPTMMWDFISLRPETIHQVSFLFSDRGTPDGYRHMNGYGSHTFKNVNAAGRAVYVKYHLKTDQGIRCLDAAEADRLASEDPDYAIRDLYNAIARGDYPSWTMYVQVMTYEQAAAAPFNPFDLTKVWPHGDYPLHEVGRMYLNENPTDYFAEVEQLAFSPSHMVPGIEPSPDKMLQARLFSYPDTHRHRLGANYQSIPCNAPRTAAAAATCPLRGGNYQRDGPMQMTSNGAGGPNYFPNSFQGPEPVADAAAHGGDTVTGNVARVETGSGNDSSSEDNYTQCRHFFNRVLSAAERERLTDNVAGSLSRAPAFVQKRAVHHLSRVDPVYGRTVREKVDALVVAEARQQRQLRSSDNHNNNNNIHKPAAALNPPRRVPPGQGPQANERVAVCPHGYSSKL